ncbi:MAG: anthranilate synthase component I family protein [Candidatus Dormibacteria bacterium]
MRALAPHHDLIPVVAELVADCDTPVSAMLALGTEGSCFLLESVEGGERVGRHTFLGHDPIRAYEVAGGVMTVTDAVELEGGTLAPMDPGSGRPEPCSDPLAALERDTLRCRVAPVPGLDIPFLGGAVGFLGYEAAGFYERIPRARSDPLGLPEAWFGLYRTIVIFDHVARNVTLVTHMRGDAPDVSVAYREAAHRLEILRDRLNRRPPTATWQPSRKPVDMRDIEPAANISRQDYMKLVERCREYILSGDIFQVQVSRRFSLPVAASPFDLYRSLRTINPSPYMFFLSTPSCALVGTSPEMLVRITGSRVQYHPIAGTRRRGHDPAEDTMMEAELRGSEKESAEHLMLVDLGRNDVGRVCRPGSVTVSQFMDVERYSHVMHLVSSIEGDLRPDHTSLDALRACFPAGTVTGAPKVRAMEIIAEQEPEARGAYAGAVGYVGFGGNVDTAIALRTIVVKDGVAHAQAAAGIVADSTAEEEVREIDNKLAVLLCAVQEARA